MEIKYECPICHQKFESRLNRDRCENVHMEKQRAENDKIMDAFKKLSDKYIDLYARYCASRDLFLDTSDTLLEFLKTNKSEIPIEEQHKVMDRISAIDSQYDEDDDVLNDDRLDDDEDEDEDGEEIDGEEIVHVLSDIFELLGPLSPLLHDKDENDDNV